MRKIIVTCEHGGNKIPDEYFYLFKDKQELLASHYAWDMGALPIAKQIAKQFADFFFYAEISRLLVDLNRSLHNRNLFSEITKHLDKQEKEKILKQYYFPYRNTVEKTILNEIQLDNQVLHLAIHSFVPIFKNQVRKVDIGLLYDPKRKPEKEFCKKIKQAILHYDQKLQVKNNQPYLGKSDGLTTYLRKKFPADSYLGIELEMNQKFFATESQQNYLSSLLINSFGDILNKS